MTKILLYLSHPHADSLNASLAKKYTESASEAGHEVQLVNLFDLNFDAIHVEPRKRFKDQDFELDLVEVRKNILRKPLPFLGARNQ